MTICGSLGVDMAEEVTVTTSDDDQPSSPPVQQTVVVAQPPVAEPTEPSVHTHAEFEELREANRVLREEIELLRKPEPVPEPVVETPTEIVDETETDSGETETVAMYRPGVIW